MLTRIYRHISPTLTTLSSVPLRSISSDHSNIKLLTFNILAPHYANPKYYPKCVIPHLDTQKRLTATLAFLNDISKRCDIIALQEVTDNTVDRVGTFDRIRDVLQKNFEGQFLPHDEKYWNSWIDRNKDSHFSYMKNGNSLFINRHSFTEPIWRDIPLTTGNYAICAKVIHRKTGISVRVLNIHLDTEDGYKKEYTSAMEAIKELSNTIVNPSTTIVNPITTVVNPSTTVANPSTTVVNLSSTIDIIMGDFNHSLKDPHIEPINRDNNFTDALTIDRKLTFSMPTSSTRTIMPIDHIIYRSGHVTPLADSDNLFHGLPSHTNTGVIDYNLWNLYPYNRNEYDANECCRLRECLRIFGSDHMPVVATMKITV